MSETNNDFRQTPAWYAAMSRLLIAAATGIYPRPHKMRARDLALVRAMLTQAEAADTASVSPCDCTEKGKG